MSGVPGRIHSFESFGTLDGPGVRCVVFFQGCPLSCGYCHNPDARAFSGGRETDSETLAAEIETYRNFIVRGGVTLSGGEPLAQPEFAQDLLLRCRHAGFHTALDTSGALPLERSAEVIETADLILLDIKAMDPLLCRKLTGQDNKNAFAVLDFCENRKKSVWIRHVLVPGWTLKEPLLRELSDHLSKYKCIERIELLPFHKMGADKWTRLGWDDPMKDVPEPTAEEIRTAGTFFPKNLCP